MEKYKIYIYIYFIPVILLTTFQYHFYLEWHLINQVHGKSNNKSKLDWHQDQQLVNLNLLNQFLRI